MTDTSFYLEQADRFDRVADQCTVTDLVPYYRQLAEAYRRMARAKDPGAPAPRGQPSPIEFPQDPERTPRDRR